MKHLSILCTLTLWLAGLGLHLAFAQSGDHFYKNDTWQASWIAPPGTSADGYGVYHYRKVIDLKQKPDSFSVKVSGDNRFKLFVNGRLVALGPASGDLYHWNYETVNIAPYLRSGKNILAATVYNEGANRPEAEISNRTGFILQGVSKNEAENEVEGNSNVKSNLAHLAAAVNTNDSWKSIKDEGYQVLPYYFVAISGQLVDMAKVIKGWKSLDFDDSKWPKAESVAQGRPKGASDGNGWMLVPSQIPQMERTYQRIEVLRKTTGMPAPAGFPVEKKAITIPANSQVTMLLDQTYLTNAYFTLKLSKGKGARVAIGYAETLYEIPTDPGQKDHPKKGNRNDIEGKFFKGVTDSILPDGSLHQDFTTLNYRTYRYVQLRIYTGDQPLIIQDIYGTFTGYPFKWNARFKTSDANGQLIQKILKTGWRTARLDAMETYMDCPYYERLQYIGDTRIQAEISYFNSGDDRLARNALNLMDHSRLPEGVTMSRWPTHTTQVISTFSLWYIGMLHDYWMYRPDSAFVAGKLMGVRNILQFFASFQGQDGSLHKVPYWKFVDWVGGPGWMMGEAPKGKDGNSALLDLQLLLAYQWATAMESKLGTTANAKNYQQKAMQLKNTIQTKYWNDTKGLFADTKEQNSFCQHVNALAILAGMVPDRQLKTFGEKLLHDRSLVQCTIYFKYYLNQALVKAGLGNGYLDWLDIWKENLKMGLTTWAEDSNLEYARSDCHAWGASPNIEFFRTVLGIDTDAPGFRKVKIEPHLGTLTNASGVIPHPVGEIQVSYVLSQGKWQIDIQLPTNTPGQLIWKGQHYNLKPGSNHFAL